MFREEQDRIPALRCTPAVPSWSVAMSHLISQVPEPVRWEGRVDFLTWGPGPGFEGLCEHAGSVDHTVAHS